MKVVPEEPTEEMLNAARDWSVAKYGIGVGNDGAIGCYKAMLAAAPPLEPVQPVAQEVAWLVERGQAQGHAPTIWLKSIAARRAHDAYENTWTENANNAERFATKADAEKVAIEVRLCDATEHVWIDAHPPRRELPAYPAEPFRYSVNQSEEDGGGLELDSAGEWVRFSDYEVMKTHIDALRAAGGGK